VISVNRAVAGAALSLGLPLPGVALDDRLHGEMAHALAAGEFLVHYQPVVRLATSQPVGMEALVRWRHPVHGLLHPSEFIGAGERSGAIVELGDRVLAAACTQAERWREAGHDLHVSVNVSVRQLTDELPGRVAAMMAATGMPAGRLWLELTETALVSDLDQARAVLSAIDALGARISIDDFGTGWASLTYLREFPVGMLKIDGSFVRGLGARSSDEAIVRSVISLGRELGLKVTAEGIETPAQRDHLLRLGCRYGQGHLFSEAVPAEDIRLEVATGPTGRLRQP
jgi:EAL domain-containing protein (putative c-di-GMP-specific phosphodiesterase class I)